MKTVKRKVGLSKTRPKNEARPLGTPRPKRIAAKKIVSKDAELLVDTPPAPVVESPKPITASSVEHPMTLTFKSLNKKNTAAIYTGARTSIRISTANFADKVPPPSLSDFSALLAAKVAAPKLTKEERAALRASKPKPTEAERIARAETALAKRKAKLAAAAASL
jgi:hypothetical protein